MHRILVIDDEESIQILFADELTEEGYEVITIGDGSKLETPTMICPSSYARPMFKLQLPRLDLTGIKSSLRFDRTMHLDIE